MEGDKHEVYYFEYCGKCKYFDTDDGDDPCDLCLSEPAMPDSHKPAYFKEATEVGKQKGK